MDDTETGWKAQILRLTAFLTAPLDSGVAEALWETATGEKPETNDLRPREGVRRQSGPYLDGRLEIIILPKRIDWVMAPAAEPNVTVAAYFASLEAAMTAFVEQGQKWLSTGSLSINRLAVGAVLLMAMADKQAAYERLKGLLKSVKLDPEHSRDFFYQINWPRNSNVVPALLLNRLTRWSAAIVGLLTFHVSLSMLQSIPIEGEHYCRLECDHNTAQDRAEPFAASELAPLLRELCGLVSENAREGEITWQEVAQ